MKSGKAAEAILKRSVIKSVNKQEKQNSVSKAGVGMDAGLFEFQNAEGTAAMACTCLTGAEEGLAALAVHRACNSLAAAGGIPAAVTVQFTLPEEMEEEGLKVLMREVVSACESTETALVQGHTQISSFVSEPVISVTALGAAGAAMTLELDIFGSDLVMTKSAGFAGSAMLAKYYRENLHERYTYAFVDGAVARQPEVSVLPEVKVLSRLGIRHMHDVAEGGVFGAVWELAERLHAGVELDLKKIPILQDTVEICEYFDVNPYQLKGDGSLLFLTHDSDAVIAKLSAQGIPAQVIGHMTDGNDRVLINEDERRFLEPNRVDEYEKARKTVRK